MHPEPNFIIATTNGHPLPVDLYASRVSCGFSSPADDHLDLELDIAKLLATNNVTLMPANDKYDPILIHPESDFEVWGVIVWVIHPTNALSRRRVNHLRNSL